MAALAALEAAEKIVERTLAVRLLADDGIDFQPDQFALRIVIQTAAPTRPLRSHEAQDLHRAGGIFQRTPSPSGTVIEIRCG